MLKPENIRVVSICEVMETINPGDTIPYMETGPLLKKWCEENDAVYYAAPRESFFEWKGVEKALAAGKSTVVVEDMS